ncbi:MAG: ACT domain-containing protein [Eubacteriales bacterium]
MTDELPDNHSIKMHVLKDNYSVCQISDPSDICFDDEFVFVGKTDDELSLVCRTSSVPLAVLAREDGWKAIKIQGVLDFSLVGILAGIATILAGLQISIFAVSTYNTDYILIKAESLLTAETALNNNGYTVV